MRVPMFHSLLIVALYFLLVAPSIARAMPEPRDFRIQQGTGATPGPKTPSGTPERSATPTPPRSALPGPWDAGPARTRPRIPEVWTVEGFLSEATRQTIIAITSALVLLLASLLLRADVRRAIYVWLRRQFSTRPDGRPRTNAPDDLPTIDSQAGAEQRRPTTRATPLIPTTERIVNTGFALRSRAGAPLDPMLPLRSGAAYYFWLEVGRAMSGSIEPPTPLPVDLLPARARLTVALFGFPGGIEIEPGSDLGELQLELDGSVRVALQPTDQLDVSVIGPIRTQRLCFPVRAPRRSGTAQLRCNIYYGQILVQSRLIEARVQEHPQRSHMWGLASVVDYTLSRSLNVAQLSQRTPHRLSLMINQNGNGTHGFRFFGSKDGEALKCDVTIDGLSVDSMTQYARHVLRHIAWGDREEWGPGKLYRYLREPINRRQLAHDLAELAIAGFRLYNGITRSFGGSPQERLMLIDRLESLMSETGMIQIALKESASFVLPVGLIYDYPWDTNAFPLETSEYRLCTGFEAALDDGGPLEDAPCFRGRCVLKAEIDTIRADDDRTIDEVGPVICPSGFWGYRHALGTPLSAGDAPDAPAEVVIQGMLDVTVGVSTDSDLPRRKDHERKLQALRTDSRWQLGETRTEVLRLLKRAHSHLIYLYCHGGVSPDGIPYLQVGSDSDAAITPDNLPANGICWTEPRPLVFINGCHTTALDPKTALEFVSTFVQDSRAIGVVGTEISVFEPLACEFAEACLRLFLSGVPIGEAIRRARLALLQANNPLGLVYIPFVLADYRLIDEARSSALSHERIPSVATSA